jgi:hypothetical protein
MVAVGVGIAVLLLVLIAVIAMNAGMRAKGYTIPGQTPVRCVNGHLFVTNWVEGGSLKAIRLGPTLRIQRCPTCQKMVRIRPVKPADLSEAERTSLPWPPV